MKAIVMQATGGPEVLQLADVAVPAPKPGELLVKVEAIGVNFRETQLRAGVIGGPLSGPLILGNETVGVVEAADDRRIDERTARGKMILVP